MNAGIDGPDLGTPDGRRSGEGLRCLPLLDELRWAGIIDKHAIDRVVGDAESAGKTIARSLKPAASRTTTDDSATLGAVELFASRGTKGLNN